MKPEEIRWKKKKSKLGIFKSYLDERLEKKKPLIPSHSLPLFPIWLHYKAVITILLWIFVLLCPWCFFFEISLGPEFAELSYLPRSWYFQEGPQLFCIVDQGVISPEPRSAPTIHCLSAPFLLQVKQVGQGFTFSFPL